MKKRILTVLVVIIGFLGFAQENKNKSQRLKYVTSAPDGTIAMTIYNDTQEGNLKLVSANKFYSYEILDPMTSEPIFSADNTGKECRIDKTKILSGTYKLRLYTKYFIITSDMTVIDGKKMNPSIQSTREFVASK